MPDIRQLSPDEWGQLRDVRLRALSDSPDSFLAQYADESEYLESRWRDEFVRGDWHVGVLDGDNIGLIGVTRDYDEQKRVEHYLEYIWVDQRWRRTGLATQLIHHILQLLRKDAVPAVNLWVLDGNAAAVVFYERLGFETTNEVNDLAALPGRTEERFRLDLT